MNLPDTLPALHQALHGHGGKQRWIVVYRNEEFGVSVTQTGEYKTWYSWDWMPGRFGSYGELRDAANALDAAALSAERAKWPQVVQRTPDPCSNKCRLCDKPPRTDHITIQMAPNKDAAGGRDQYFNLCTACTPLLDEGAAAMVERLRAEVAARRAAAKLKGTP